MVTYWLCLNAADTVITLRALELGHGEGNLIMSGMGSAEFVVYKVIMTLVTLVLLWLIRKWHLLKVLNLSLVAVVLWNSVWIIIS